jgi:hypothetical protein
LQIGIQNPIKGNGQGQFGLSTAISRNQMKRLLYHVYQNITKNEILMYSQYSIDNRKMKKFLSSCIWTVLYIDSTILTQYHTHTHIFWIIGWVRYVPMDLAAALQRLLALC